MNAQTTSLSRSDEVPAAPVSETKALGDAAPVSGTVAVSAGTDGPALDADWPSLAVLSRRYIDRALGHTRGNKTRAADLLGIDRRTLNRILARERARKAAAAKPAE
jgi:DNA-binding NtrC family response regulator